MLYLENQNLNVKLANYYFKDTCLTLKLCARKSFIKLLQLQNIKILR